MNHGLGITSVGDDLFIFCTAGDWGHLVDTTEVPLGADTLTEARTSFRRHLADDLIDEARRRFGPDGFPW